MPDQYEFSREVRSVVLRLCEDIATPRALTVKLLLQNGEFDQLARLRVDPLHYLDGKAEAYRSDAIVTSFLRKLEDLPTSFDRKGKALENFWLSEKQCYKTNERLSPFLNGALNHPADEGVHQFILAVRKYLYRVLGPVPSLLEGKHGPGATYGDKGQYATIPDKMSSCPTLTSSSVPYLFQWCGTAWASACAASGRHPTFVRGNRFTTVPKDAEKDRGICIEPSVNLFYQLSYGEVIKRRLKRAGIDLRNGQTIHRRVACEASKQGHFATLDLSNASDTVCSNLVKLLLPPDWFEALDMLRSPCTLLGNNWVRLEKFSSMGNGYTFELETLIFLALSVVACNQDRDVPALAGVDIFVYGDDIIVPTECTKNVLAVLRYFGFTPNEEKSFVAGPFRESCGGDYFNGVDVRPFFLKESPSEPQHYIAMANGLYRMGSSDPVHGIDDPRFRRAWFSVLDALPSHIRRIRGPQTLGDTTIHDAERHQRPRWRHSIRYFPVYRPHRHRTVAWAHFRPEVILACALYGTGDGRQRGNPTTASDNRTGVTPRDSVLSFKLGWSPSS